MNNNNVLNMRNLRRMKETENNS